MIITFVGHRTIGEINLLKEKIRSVILKEITKQEKITFYCGGYGGFDITCANACREIKTKVKEAEIVLVTPYLKQEYLKNINEQNLYDSIVYPPIENVPFRLAIIKRNEWMVEKASLIIAYVEHSYGGAYKTLEFAKRKNKRIINLATQKL